MTVVDVHTHVYPPALMDILRQRTQIPYVRSFADDPAGGERLIILPAEEAAVSASLSAAAFQPQDGGVKGSNTGISRGRPIGPAYHDVNAKLAFMDRHGIDVSVLSLANPWLDWLPAEDGPGIAKVVNDDVEAMCAAHPGRLYAFGTLPLSAASDAVVAEVQRLATLPYHRGIVMGTSGLGQGLDDPALDPIYAAVQEENLMIFLHPHYGLPEAVYGPRAHDYGHVLPLAMGFPLETTIAVTRMLLSGVFDRFPKLNVLLAHSGGTLPFLAGRIESCIAHDAHLQKAGQIGNRRDVWDILKTNIYLDAVIYSEVGLKAAIDASGADRLMYGTDHPFFPPLDEGEEQWLSVTLNTKAVKAAGGQDSQAIDAIMGSNAVRILRLNA